MTMWRAVALLVVSLVVAAIGILMVVGKVQSGLVNAEINERSTGAGVGDNPATPTGSYGLQSEAAATITAIIREATAEAATAAAARTPVPSTPGTGAGGLAAIGQQTELGGSRFTVHQVVDPEPPGIFQTTAGNRRIALEISQQAISARTTHSFSFFQLRDASGTPYPATITNSSPSFQSGQLQPGETRRGWVSFQVPEGVTPVTLTVSVPGVVQAAPIISLQ